MPGDRTIEYAHFEGNTAVVTGRHVVIGAARMPLAGRWTSLWLTANWNEEPDKWKETVRHETEFR